jgi:hypothetical protein
MNNRRRQTERARAVAEQRQGSAPPRGYASPPCAMHEVDSAYMGLPEEPVRRPRKRRAANPATLTTDGNGSGG